MLIDILFQIATPTPTPTPTLAPDYGIMEFLRDPLWQFIGAVLALAAIALTIWLTVKDRQRKRFTPIVLSHGPLISIAEEQELRNRLIVSFDNQLLAEPDIYAFIIRFMNTGNIALTREDMSDPVRIDFNPEAEVLTVNVLETGPEPFDAKAESDGSRAILNPVLMNKGQFVTVKILVRNYKFVLRAYVHITDTKPDKLISVEEWLEKRDRGRYQLLWYLVFWFAGYGAYDILADTLKRGLGWLSTLMAFAVIGALVILLIEKLWKFIQRYRGKDGQNED
jgi:hypothetical protein